MIEINMQMPEKCGLCPCFHFGSPMYCQAVKADKNRRIVNPYGSPRPEWCPLKEQEPVKPKYIPPKSIYSWECGVCAEPFDRIANYCPNCGRPVKWDD